MDHIENLNVSASWKNRFILIERAGGIKLPNMKELTFSEKFRIRFNIWALFLGPIYFICKGLWRQAIVYVGLVIILVVGLNLLGQEERFARIASYAFGAICALRANISYYARVVLNKYLWF